MFHVTRGDSAIRERDLNPLRLANYALAMETCGGLRQCVLFGFVTVACAAGGSDAPSDSGIRRDAGSRPDIQSDHDATTGPPLHGDGGTPLPTDAAIDKDYGLFRYAAEK